jgi:hypothetical protein
MKREAWLGTGLQEADPNVILAFVQVDHPALGEPIRVVSDVPPLNYLWRGHLWQAMPFAVGLLTEGEAAPETRLVMQNIDRRIGQVLQSLTGRTRISLWVLSSGQFDLTADPREPIGDPQPQYSLEQFDLIDVSVDAASIEGRVMMRDYTQEPFPYIRATEARFPGLFV